MKTKSIQRVRARVHKPGVSDAALLKWEASNWGLVEKKLVEADAAIARGDVREISLDAFLREARSQLKKKRA
jgi:hypothetical protein